MTDGARLPDTDLRAPRRHSAPRAASGAVSARRRRRAVPAAALGAVAVVLAACGSSSSSGSTTTTDHGAAAASGGSTSTTATVKVATVGSFGPVLENSSGMALYTYGPNHGGQQNMCTGACLQAWPALTVPAGTTPSAGSGVSGSLAAAKQADGTYQVTYDGNLLYTFLSDQPGQVTGNGVAGFSVAKVTSAAAAATPTAAPPATPNTSSGGSSNY